MLKHLSLCAAFLIFGSGSLHAEQQGLVLHKMQVPGAEFDIVFVMNKPQPAGVTNMPGPDNSLIVQETGDAIAFAIDGEVEKFFKDIDVSQFPIHAFRVERKGINPSGAVNVYVVPKSGMITLSAE